ncbi:hypothetical protein Lal_00008164 [Lupinus albus]|uniref:Putative ANTH domain-containing protein n=1 Tax=Lupinus albus TaxID=3870 RepID=A0A6A4PNU0_LUPAL|nr:putative ANTH domain-containing protein [Lupinus albus]KAF1868357.1 hypothetical protein Lal_00008164 [Lupinus albus]
MSPSTLRRAIGAVKDQTSIGLAKVGSKASLADLDVAIVKATRHDEYPAEEKYIREILGLTSYSLSFISACVNTLSRRLSKTNSWTVTLKTLMLIQRLLSDGDPAYEKEIFFATRRGTRLLNMSDFRDNKKSNSWDFSAFVRTYALYLDERLEYRMQNRRGRCSGFGLDDNEEEPRKGERDRYRERELDKYTEREKDREIKATPLPEMKNEQLFSKMQHLQLLLERFLACRPTGGAKTHRLVIVAIYPIVKESIQIYHEMTEILGNLIDRFTEMEVQECIRVYDIFCRVGKQYDELDLFYSWSKSTGIGRSSEYPEIERVTTKKLEIMDDYIKDKSMLAQTKKHREQKNDRVEAQEQKETEDDRNAIKALPAPETFHEELAEKVKEEIKVQEPKEEKVVVVQTEGDLLNPVDEMVTHQEHGDKLALALFDGVTPVPTPSVTKALPWHAFDDEGDWETSLIQSPSNLPNQKPSLGGGFDTLLLDSMYKQASTNAATEGPGYGVCGSANSIALGSDVRPAMLALPAPTTLGSGSNLAFADPFAASMGGAPPAYVQMSEIEKKQSLLQEEQIMWQQYARSGMQGQDAFTKLQPYNNTYMGGYPQYPQNYGNYYYH